MYFEKLKQNLMTSRVAKDTKKIELYSYLLGQVTLKTKTPSDDEIFKTIKSYIKSLKNVNVDKPDFIEKCNFEISELENFLPKQLSDNDIKDILSSIDISDFKSVVTFFTQNYSGQYNPGDLRKVWLEVK